MASYLFVTDQAVCYYVLFNMKPCGYTNYNKPQHTDNRCGSYLNLGESDSLPEARVYFEGHTNGYINSYIYRYGKEWESGL